MSEGARAATGAAWAPRRFWQKVTCRPAEAPGLYQVFLDTRPAKTPAKAPLAVPGQALAEALAEEWQAQDGAVNPATMPLTRLANTAIDRVSKARAAVLEDLAGYGASDLLCYRAEGPAALVAQEAAAWDPALAWADQALGAPLAVTQGITAIDQPPASLAALRAHLEALDDFALAATADAVSLTGSLVLGLALAKGHFTAEKAWALCQVDEAYQTARWGHDAEAAAKAAQRAAALDAAGRFLALCQGRGRLQV